MEGWPVPMCGRSGTGSLKCDKPRPPAPTLIPSHPAAPARTSVARLSNRASVERNASVSGFSSSVTRKPCACRKSHMACACNRHGVGERAECGGVDGCKRGGYGYGGRGGGRGGER
eukprot:194452-Chlamydomonas_euryale.AAC.1